MSFEQRAENVRAIWDSARQLEEQSKVLKKEWYLKTQQLQKECTHKFADGSSAWKHNYVYSDCTICGYSDL